MLAWRVPLTGEETRKSSLYTCLYIHDVYMRLRRRRPDLQCMRVKLALLFVNARSPFSKARRLHQKLLFQKCQPLPPKSSSPCHPLSHSVLRTVTALISSKMCRWWWTNWVQTRCPFSCQLERQPPSRVSMTWWRWGPSFGLERSRPTGKLEHCILHQTHSQCRIAWGPQVFGWERETSGKIPRHSKTSVSRFQEIFNDVHSPRAMESFQFFSPMLPTSNNLISIQGGMRITTKHPISKWKRGVGSQLWIQRRDSWGHGGAMGGLKKNVPHPSSPNPNTKEIYSWGEACFHIPFSDLLFVFSIC